jgi:hypothetical protein
MSWETAGELVSRTEFCGTWRQRYLIKKKLDCPGKIVTNRIPTGGMLFLCVCVACCCDLKLCAF